MKERIDCIISDKLTPRTSPGTREPPLKLYNKLIVIDGRGQYKMSSGGIERIEKLQKIEQVGIRTVIELVPPTR